MINKGNLQQVLDKLKELGYDGVEAVPMSTEYTLQIPAKGYGHAMLNYDGVYFDIKLNGYVHPSQQLADAMSELNTAGQDAMNMNTYLRKLNGIC